ncbi:MAG: glycerophosphodiester phosphodiesterase family protein [Pseudomonadota bacterium]
MARLSQLISHRFRGFSDHESTMDGLVAALDFGVLQIEFDIRLTRCGLPLITHDEAAMDRAGRMRHVKDVRAAELGRLGGAFARMPSAPDLFAAIAAHDNKACRILIDVKDAGFEDMLYALCAAHGLRERTLWVSWLPEVLYAMRDIDPDAPLCLSHWCAPPDASTRSVHTVFEARSNHIPRPDRRFVHGERSGWFVDGPLRGELREMVDWVCVPASQISRTLVDDYHADGTQVSAFSYVTGSDIERAERQFGHDAFFCDAREPFETVV